MESYVRIEGRGLKNLTYPYMGVGGVKNCQNHPYVINEWPLTAQVLFSVLHLFRIIAVDGAFSQSKCKHIICLTISEMVHGDYDHHYGTSAFCVNFRTARHCSAAAWLHSGAALSHRK